jgi:hypothetical protein
MRAVEQGPIGQFCIGIGENVPKKHPSIIGFVMPFR